MRRNILVVKPDKRRKILEFLLFGVKGKSVRNGGKVLMDLSAEA